MTLLLIAAAMAVKDLCADTGVVLIAKGHGWSAAFADIIGDMAGVLSIGVSGVEAVHNGASWTTAAVLGALAVGSLIGTVAGTRLGAIVANRLETS